MTWEFWHTGQLVCIAYSLIPAQFTFPQAHHTFQRLVISHLSLPFSLSPGKAWLLAEERDSPSTNSFKIAHIKPGLPYPEHKHYKDQLASGSTATEQTRRNHAGRVCAARSLPSSWFITRIPQGPSSCCHRGSLALLGELIHPCSAMVSRWVAPAGKSFSCSLAISGEAREEDGRNQHFFFSRYSCKFQTAPSSVLRALFSAVNAAVSASPCLVLQGLVCPGAERLICPARVDLEPGCFWRSLLGSGPHHDCWL